MVKRRKKKTMTQKARFPITSTPINRIKHTVKTNQSALVGKLSALKHFQSRRI